MQTFREVREEDCYYVDKTPYIARLLLRRHKLAAHWFETGTPAFLVETLLKRQVSSVSLGQTFHAFFASTPYQWYTNDHYEGFYASVVYSYFAALGYEIVEESSSHGRLDMAVRTGGHVYLFEFKVVEMAPPGSALAQLRERGYADKYRGGSEPIHLIGVEFSRETRNVTAFEVADG